MKVVDARRHPLNPLHTALEQRRLIHLDHDAYLKITDGTPIYHPGFCGTDFA